MNIPQQIKTEDRRRQARTVPATPRYREESPYDTMPDWALVGAHEVGLLTRMGRSRLDAAIQSGEIAPPSRHGRLRVWSLGYIREWCRAKTAASDKAAACLGQTTAEADHE